MITSVEEFIRLRTSDSAEDQYRASHDDAPEAVWHRVIDEHPEMRSWVAHNKAVPLSVLEVLSLDADPSVRCTVASKRKLTFLLRERLARDPDASVRARVAYNAKCEVELLRQLSQDPEAIVREPAERRLREKSLKP